MKDLREILYSSIAHRIFTAELTAERDGILSGYEAAREKAAELGVDFDCFVPEGGALEEGKVFARLQAYPERISMAEEQLIGTLAKASGIATAAHEAAKLADGRIRIAAGAWKKMPPECKQMVRRAVVAGGISFRICEPPMIYMDKNYIAMSGSVKKALEAARELEGYTRIVQIRGKFGGVEEETMEALSGGCHIFMVDTGKIEDLDRCIGVLKQKNAFSNVEIGFAGNVKLSDIEMLASRGVSVLCIGKEIVDAPLMDIKLDIRA